VPLVSDAKFMDHISTVVGGAGLEYVADVVPAGEQFALF
jgi:hypothetical protein